MFEDVGMNGCDLQREHTECKSREFQKELCKGLWQPRGEAQN